MVKVISSLILLAIASSTLAEEPNWPRFRGTNGSGIGSGSVPTEWSEKHILWETAIDGKGHGSPAIWGDRIFLLNAVAKSSPSSPPPAAAQPAKGKAKKKGKSKPQALDYRFVAMAIDRQTGELLWTTDLSPGKFKGHRFNSPASSTA
ncbi:MAG: hypothetical protein AAF226_17040, partial [Verrucomicrobiota bacterium]